MSFAFVFQPKWQTICCFAEPLFPRALRLPHFSRSIIETPEQIIPFFSYMILHANFTHLLVNMAWLLTFGSIVARRFDTRSFFALFFLSGLGGAFLQIALSWGSPMEVVGASGAISGLMGAAFRMPGPPVPWMTNPPLIPLFSRRVLLWSAVWIGINLIGAFTNLDMGAGVHAIAWQVHLGGYFTGLALAGPFDRLSRLKTNNQ